MINGLNKLARELLIPSTKSSDRLPRGWSKKPRWVLLFPSSRRVLILRHAQRINKDIWKSGRARQSHAKINSGRDTRARRRLSAEQWEQDYVPLRLLTHSTEAALSQSRWHVQTRRKGSGSASLRRQPVISAASQERENTDKKLIKSGF